MWFVRNGGSRVPKIRCRASAMSIAVKIAFRSSTSGIASRLTSTCSQTAPAEPTATCTPCTRSIRSYPSGVNEAGAPPWISLFSTAGTHADWSGITILIRR